MSDETSTTPEQKSQESLTTNFPIPSNAQRRTFMPEMPSQGEISARRVNAFKGSDWPGANYENNMARGPKMGGGANPGDTDAKLKKQS